MLQRSLQHVHKHEYKHSNVDWVWPQKIEFSNLMTESSNKQVQLMPSAKQQPSNVKHGGAIRPNVWVLTFGPPCICGWNQTKRFPRPKVPSAIINFIYLQKIFSDQNYVHIYKLFSYIFNIIILLFFSGCAACDFYKNIKCSIICKNYCCFLTMFLFYRLLEM